MSRVVDMWWLVFKYHRDSDLGQWAPAQTCAVNSELGNILLVDAVATHCIPDVIHEADACLHSPQAASCRHRRRFFCI